MEVWLYNGISGNPITRTLDFFGEPPDNSNQKSFPSLTVIQVHPRFSALPNFLNKCSFPLEVQRNYPVLSPTIMLVDRTLYRLETV